MKIETEAVRFTGVRGEIIRGVRERDRVVVTGPAAAQLVSGMENKSIVKVNGEKFRLAQCAIDTETGEHTFYLDPI